MEHSTIDRVGRDSQKWNSLSLDKGRASGTFHHGPRGGAKSGTFHHRPGGGSQKWNIPSHTHGGARNGTFHHKQGGEGEPEVEQSILGQPVEHSMIDGEGVLAEPEVECYTTDKGDNQK